MMRRVNELHLLRAPSFAAACHAAGFRLIAPGELAHAEPLPRAA